MDTSNLAAVISQLQATMASASSFQHQPSMPTFSTLNTVKLSSTNFPIWSRQITPYLHSQRLFGYVDGSLPCPLPTAPDDQAPTDWHTKDQLVVAILTASLTESAMAQILDCTTSKQIWGRLHKTFAATSSTQIV